MTRRSKRRAETGHLNTLKTVLLMMLSLQRKGPSGVHTSLGNSIATHTRSFRNVFDAYGADPPEAAAISVILVPCGCNRAPVASGPEQAAGYTLNQQLMSRTTDLVDREGMLVHRWRSRHGLASGARLLANGDLIRTGTSDA